MPDDHAAGDAAVVPQSLNPPLTDSSTHPGVIGTAAMADDGGGIPQPAASQIKLVYPPLRDRCTRPEVTGVAAMADDGVAGNAANIPQPAAPKARRAHVQSGNRRKCRGRRQFLGHGVEWRQSADAVDASQLRCAI